MAGSFDVAQVCRNGHSVNDRVQRSPQFNRPYCEECGASTMTACEACNAPIPGDYETPGVVAIGFSYEPPAFCGQCGQPFPWTAGRLEAARELISEADTISDDERRELTATLPDIVREIPMTIVAAGRFNRLAGKLAKGTADSLREILVDIASETAKKIIWPT